MIEPSEIPQYTGDFDKLATAVTHLRTYATGIRNNGQDVHSRFQATAGYYKAPEAEQLFSSTRPVMDTADTFATHIESLADALDIFTAEAKPHADRLKQLKLDAITFVGEVQGDDGWTKDQKKVDRDKALWDGVNEARAAFQDAERRAANKIEAIAPAICRPTWIVDDGTHAKGMYGESTAMLKDIGTLPWGSPDERTYERWSLDWWGHGAKSWAWDGLAKDSIWGGIDGIGTLLGYHGEAARNQAWDGLRRTVVGGYAYGMDLIGEGDHLSSWQRDSKAYAKEFGKQFVAYDMQKKDPARAHAVVFFNLITLASGPAAGVARLGKGGTIAKAAGTVAKIGDVLDPISGSLKAVKALSDLPKVSQVLANVTDHFQIPKSKFPDAIFDLDHRYRVGEDGRLIPINADGTPNLAPAPRGHEGDLATGAGRGERELAGVGAEGHAHGVAGRAGEGLPPRGSHETHGGSGKDTGPAANGHGGRESDHPTGHTEHGEGSASHHGPDHGGSGGAADDGPHTPHGPGDGGTGGGDTSGGHGAASPGGEGQPMVRGGETEQRLRDAVKGIPGKVRPNPKLLEKVIDRLTTEADGQRVADIIASGQFNQSDEFATVVKSLGAGRKQMFQPGADQLIFADDLVKSGVPAHSIDFELKHPPGADVDVRIADESGKVYAYQMKHLNDPADQVGEITRPKYLNQLAIAEADYRVLLVDGGRGTRAEWMANGSYDELMAVRRDVDHPENLKITFVIRLKDGNLVVPPGSKLDPKDIL
ncbi:hypothetical protein ACFPFX_22155 [Streptomyces mauvecolor]|uniref:Protein NO VEIN C-terminal domain-containing protein n=1 Tax=Streptomyces mauvecolor TaxID=58345 RepID=A0ABV9UTQ4_9ACTN